VSAYVSLDGYPNLRFECASIAAEGWNGWAVPVMTVAQVLAAIRAIQEADKADPWITGVAVVDGVGGTIRIYFHADADDEVLSVHPDGTVHWDGWQWADVLVPNLPCPTCGAAAHADCAPDCMDDEALRYGDHTDPAPASAPDRT
jgi:hypothetical protein